MTFRDDRDAQVARIDLLEQELEAARRRIEVLEGHPPPQPPAPLQPALPRLAWPPYTYDSSGVYARTYELDAELTKERCREVIESIAQVANRGGRLDEQRSQHVAWRAGDRKIELVVEDGRSKLRCSDWYGQNVVMSRLVLVGLVVMIWTQLPVWWAQAGAVLFLVVGWLSIGRGTARRRERSKQLFDRAAGLLGGEVFLGELPPGPAIAAGDPGAR